MRNINKTVEARKVWMDGYSFSREELRSLALKV